jgi:hypothetical protein
MSTLVSTKEEPRQTATELLILWLRASERDGGGLAALKRARPLPSKTTLLRLALSMRERGMNQPAELVLGWKSRLYPAKHGRQSPTVGETAIYSVMGTAREKNARWSRIPMSTLGLEPGDRVMAVFRPGKIVLRAVKDSAAAMAEPFEEHMPDAPEASDHPDSVFGSSGGG